MPKKKITKDKISITVDKMLLKKLQKRCDERLMKVSTYIEHLIREGMERE
jgi:hypothetical protein